MRYVYVGGIIVLLGVYLLTTSSNEEVVEETIKEENSVSKKESPKISFDDKVKVDTPKKESPKNSMSQEQASKIAKILKGSLKDDDKKSEVVEEVTKESEPKEVMSKADRAYEMIQEKGLIEFNQEGYIGGVSKHMIYANFDPDEVEVDPDLPPAIPVMVKGVDMKGIPFKIPVDANMYKYAKANGKKIYVGILGESNQVEDLIPIDIGSNTNQKQISNMPPMPPSN